MIHPEILIRTAKPEDADAISAFRISQYKTAKEFEILDLEALSKQRGLILIAEIDGVIISTMQMETVADVEEFNRVDGDVTHEIRFKSYPTLYLSKAATVKQFRNTGLNSLLRKICLEYALQQEDINSLSGIAYENAPRLHLLQRLGYTLTVIKHSAITYAKPAGSVLFLCLLREQFATALESLNQEVADLYNSFSIVINLFMQSPNFFNLQQVE